MTDAYTPGLMGLADVWPTPPDVPTHTATVHNRFCADALTVSLRIEAGRIVAIGATGDACVVCRASLTKTCELLAGQPLEAVQTVENALDTALDGAAEGPFGVLAPVHTIPSRHACARLPLDAVRRALVPRTPPAPSIPGTQVGTAPLDADGPWSAALAFRERGLDVAVATLVDVVGSSPCPLGSHMVVASNGEFWGAVSGGCVESAVVQASIAMLADDRKPRTDAYQIANSQAGEVGLPCGGRVQIHIGPAPGDTQLRHYQARGRGLGRVLDLETGTERLDAVDAERPARVGDQFVEPLLAPPRLVMVGGTRIAQSLSALARTLGYAPVVVEPREGFAGPGRFDGPVRVEPADTALTELIDADTAVVMLTHDARIDDPGLRVALASDAFYVGALGSRKTQRARLERLAAAGVPADQLARLRGPAGLPIGAIGPEEIALSILAEIVAARRRAEPAGTGSVVLAAGSSRRAGPANKLLQDIDGEPMVRRVVRTVLAAGVGPCVVVLGHDADAVRAVLDDLPVQFVLNPDHADGMGTSIAAGIEAIGAHGVGAAFVVLSDMPWFGPDALTRLARAHTPATQHLVVVPVAGDADTRRRGNPVLWPARYFDALRALRGDVGGKSILARAPGAVLEVQVDDAGVLDDVDVIRS